jgi:two-component system, cell cycle sensor histidine kinase and response regulator CckA
VKPNLAKKTAPRRSDDKFRLFFQENPQPMWVFDRETLGFLEINEAAVKLYGYSREEFLGMRITDLQPADEVPALLEGTPHLHAALQPLEWHHRLKNGQFIDVEMSTREIVYGGSQAVLAVLIDVTRRKQLEAQLLQSQKMEAVGMLAGGIAHDFNNLLTIIGGYSQLLLASLPPTDRNRSAVEQIMKAGERAAALTRQLLAFSRRQVLQPKVLDLNLLVGSLAVMLRRLIGEDIDLRLELARDLGQVNADAGQIEQVIMNLAVNSRDAMPKGGTLTIQTANVELDENYMATHTRVKPGSYVMLAVSDTGFGMDAQTRSRLFEPFFTTKQQGRGTGLGLSIVFGIVRQTGGNVEVSSEPGMGTSVKLYLPRAAQAAAPEVESPVEKSERGSETILLVEDEEMVRKLVSETLEHEGYKILQAAGPEQAGKICREYDGRIDLMITDVVMPKESGRALAARLAEVRPEMKVLYMSGYTDTGILETGADSPPLEFLQKPFTPSALASKVRNVLNPANGDKCRHAGG